MAKLLKDPARLTGLAVVAGVFGLAIWGIFKKAGPDVDRLIREDEARRAMEEAKMNFPPTPEHTGPGPWTN